MGQRDALHVGGRPLPVETGEREESGLLSRVVRIETDLKNMFRNV